MLRGRAALLFATQDARVANGKIVTTEGTKDTKKYKACKGYEGHEDGIRHKRVQLDYGYLADTLVTSQKSVDHPSRALIHFLPRN